MAASMGEQTEEGAFGVPVAGAARPVVSSTSRTEAARPEPSSVQVAVSVAGWTEGAHPRHPSQMWQQASLCVRVTCPLYS